MPSLGNVPTLRPAPTLEHLRCGSNADTKTGQLFCRYAPTMCCYDSTLHTATIYYVQQHLEQWHYLLLDCEQLGRVGFPLFVVPSLLFVQAAGQSPGAVFQVPLQLLRRFVLGLHSQRGGIRGRQRAGAVATFRATVKKKSTQIKVGMMFRLCRKRLQRGLSELRGGKRRQALDGKKTSL